MKDVIELLPTVVVICVIYAGTACISMVLMAISETVFYWIKMAAVPSVKKVLHLLIPRSALLALTIATILAQLEAFYAGNVTLLLVNSTTLYPPCAALYFICNRLGELKE